MCIYTRGEVKALLVKGTKRRSGLSGLIRRHGLVKNKCGAMHDGKTMKRHKIGSEWFKPCGVGDYWWDGTPQDCQLHHIDCDPANDRKRNHVNLCLKCHARIHDLLRTKHLASYADFKRWVKREGLKTSTDFTHIKTVGLLPDSIPSSPSTHYTWRRKWKGWSDVLGASRYVTDKGDGVYATRNLAYRVKPHTYLEHRKFAQQQGVTTLKQWRKLVRSLGGCSKCGYYSLLNREFSGQYDHVKFFNKVDVLKREYRKMRAIVRKQKLKSVYEYNHWVVSSANESQRLSDHEPGKGKRRVDGSAKFPPIKARKRFGKYKAIKFSWADYLGPSYKG